ncbi:hypothetical protein [Microbacterium sp.]|uniref:hypothetical protein n=1 Tax=Microbacterium sp. TaxID=51671 RepID=UPI0039E4F218
MMEQTQIITLILTSTVVGGIVMKLFDVTRDAIAGHLQKRRAEVDKAIAERNKARADRDWWERWADVLEESLRIHRRQMIDAPCLDVDDMPPYPSRPSKEKS